MLMGYKRPYSTKALKKRATASLKLICLAYGWIGPAPSYKRSSETSESEEDTTPQSKRRPANDRNKHKTPERKSMRAQSAEEEETDGFSPSDIESHAVNAGPKQRHKKKSRRQKSNIMLDKSHEDTDSLGERAKHRSRKSLSAGKHKKAAKHHYSTKSKHHPRITTAKRPTKRVVYGERSDTESEDSEDLFNSSIDLSHKYSPKSLKRKRDTRRNGNIYFLSDESVEESVQESSDAEREDVSTHSYEKPPNAKRKKASDKELRGDLRDQLSRASIEHRNAVKNGHRNRKQEKKSANTKGDTTYSNDECIEESNDEWLSTDTDALTRPLKSNKFVSLREVNDTDKRTEDDIVTRISRAGIDHTDRSKNGRSTIKIGHRSGQQHRKATKSKGDTTHLNDKSMEKDIEEPSHGEDEASPRHAKPKKLASPKRPNSPDRRVEEDVVDRLSRTSLEPTSPVKDVHGTDSQRGSPQKAI
jgi:hypothetical protein